MSEETIQGEHRKPLFQRLRDICGCLTTEDDCDEIARVVFESYPINEKMSEEKQFTIEGMDEAFAAMDEPSKTTMPIMSPLNAALFLLADIRRAVGDTTGKLMQSELVSHCGEIYRESQLYRQMHKDWKENQGEMRRLKKCDKCGELVDIDHGSVHGKCNQVWGRRGWRTLGEYDG